MIEYIGLIKILLVILTFLLLIFTSFNETYIKEGSKNKLTRRGSIALFIGFVALVLSIFIEITQFKEILNEEKERVEMNKLANTKMRDIIFSLIDPIDQIYFSCSFYLKKEFLDSVKLISNSSFGDSFYIRKFYFPEFIAEINKIKLKKFPSRSMNAYPNEIWWKYFQKRFNNNRIALMDFQRIYGSSIDSNSKRIIQDILDDDFFNDMIKIEYIVFQINSHISEPDIVMFTNGNHSYPFHLIELIKKIEHLNEVCIKFNKEKI
ncbi:MAG: hypothetical protein IPO86_12825 [Saprospiraceae bacterium]|nr:hypothetical protein [Saprospiraceae bacterium]